MKTTTDNIVIIWLQLMLRSVTQQQHNINIFVAS